jgi:hypothetical protein
MKRDNHYEAAFEAYLRQRGVGVVAVDEAKRSLLGDSLVKSIDFIIIAANDAKLVVDVKGRRFPSGSAERGNKTWQNWTTTEDLDALDRWATAMGREYRGVLAFTYHIVPPYQLPPDTPDVFVHREQTYLLRAITTSDYRAQMRKRSTRWNTVHLPTAAFRAMVKPFSSFLEPVLEAKLV